MVEVRGVRFGYGAVTFHNEVKAKKATSKTTGNVTINNSAQPGSPAHFDVSFMLSCDLTEGGLDFTNIFHWSVMVVPEAGKPALYGEVEGEAARQLAPMLRAVANTIEAEVAKTDAKSAADA